MRVSLRRWSWTSAPLTTAAAAVRAAVYEGNVKVSAEPFIKVEIDLPSIWGETPDEPRNRHQPEGLRAASYF